MRVWFFLSSAMIVALATFCGGCASPPAKKPADAEPQPAMRGMGQPAQVPTQPAEAEDVTTESIGSQIRRQLNADPISSAGIIVEVGGDTVTLRGKAPDLAASWRAEAIAHAVKGVKTVVNEIIVPPPPVKP
jgi:osmotically-inducible protein OsmY